MGVSFLIAFLPAVMRIKPRASTAAPASGMTIVLFNDLMIAAFIVEPLQIGRD